MTTWGGSNQSRYISVRADVEIDLGDIDIDILREELRRRTASVTPLPAGDADLHRLADFIAEARTAEALDLLHKIAPQMLRPEAVQRFAAIRKAGL